MEFGVTLVLIRCVRGEREDSACRLLHVWRISISAVFVLVAGKRAIYLLPIYPAIALLAARAIDKMTLRVTQSSRRLRTAAIGVGIVLFDLTLMFANHDVWRGVKSKNARLAFIEKINATIPAHTPLFATPEVDNTALIVIAYRLRREINRKPIACGEPNDYFLSPLKGGNLAGFEPRVLVSSETDRIALVTLLSGKPAS